jgi:hypothetical protein
MFNSTDASDGTLKWLAGLSQAMNLGKFKDDSEAQSYRLKVSKKGSVENLNAISEIKNFKGAWDGVYNDYLNVLDKQYVSTAINNKLQGSYDNSWKFRPTALQDYYNECSSGGSSMTPQSKSTEKTISEPEVKEPKTSSKIDVVDPNNKPISNSEADDIRRKILSLNYNKETTPTSKGSVEPTPTTPIKTVGKVDDKVTKPEAKSVIKRAKRGVLSPDEEL